MSHLLTAYISLIYPFASPEQDVSMPVSKKVNNIDADKYERLVTIWNAEAGGMWGWIQPGIDGMLWLVTAYILPKNPLTSPKLGKTIPVLQEVSKVRANM
jgi:hypothetical protein